MPGEPDDVRAAQHDVLASLPPTTSAPPDEGPGIVANSAVNIAGRAVGHGLSALSGFITAAVLGEGIIGALAVIFGFVELGRGFSNFTHNPSIMEVHRGKDPTSVFGTSLALKLTGATVLFVVLALMGPWLGEAFDVPYLALLLASLVLMAGTFFEVGAARLEAENRMVLSNLLLASGPIVGLLSILAFWLTGTLNLYTSIVSTLLANVTMSVGFALAWRGPLRFRFDTDVAWYLVHYGFRLVVATFLTTALIWTDTLLMSYLRGNDETGIYQTAFNMTFAMVTLSVSIGVALVPALSRLAGRGDSTVLAYQRATVLALVLSVAIALVYAAFGKWFLQLLGHRFVEGYPALLVLTLFGIAGALAVPAQSILTVHGHANWIMALSVAQLVVNFPLNWVLIQSWGPLGAAVATTVVFVLGTAASWVLVRKAIGAWPLSREVFRELRQGVLHRR